MIKDPNDTKFTEVARQSRRATLASLLAGCIFFAFLILGLSALIRSQQFGETVKFMGLITVTLGILFFGLALIGDQLVRQYHWRWDAPLMILLWVFILPAIYFLCINLAFTINETDPFRSLLTSGESLVNRVPVLWMWQNLILCWFMLRVKKLNPLRIFPMKGEDAVLASLAGLGLALTAIFAISILSNLFPTLQPYNTGALEINTIMPWIFLVFALSLFPWAAEQYFRGSLQDELAGKLGRNAGVGLSALLFALLPFQWVFFLPMLIIGIGLGMLREKRGLSSAVIAHIVCNLVVLGLFSSFFS